MKVTNEMVQRAVNYYYRMHQMCMEPNNMRNALDIALRDVEAASAEKANRWDAFSYEEIEKLMYGLIEAESEDSHPGSDELRARLTTELDREHTRRKVGYQGPGVYEVSTGRKFEVLGRHGEDGGIVLRDVGDTSGHLYFETWNKFNYLGLDDTPTYRYLRPLDSEKSAS
jgi:hypothetical protein